MPFPGLASMRRMQARLRHFLGRDLPLRTLDLRFDSLPSPRRGNRPPLTEAALDKLLEPRRITPVEYAEALLAQVRAINRHPLSAPRRWAVNEMLTKRAAVELLGHLPRLAREGAGIPEQSGRAALMDVAQRLVVALLDGYRLLFATDYARSQFWYARCRYRVHRCAGRILELVRLQHRLLGLRYAPLPSQSWRLANTVYGVMRAYESTDLPLPTLAALAGLAGAVRECALNQLYGSIQAFRLFDYSAWPEVGQSYIDSYSAGVDQAIRILPYDGYSPISARDILLTACYQDSPPARSLPRGLTPDELGPSVIIDYRNLAQTVRYDFAELSRSRAERNPMTMPRRLAALEPVYQTAVGYLLARNLRPPEEWENPGTGRRDHRDLRIYVGLQEVRAHLVTIFANDERLHQARELSNIFSRRSAVIGADDSATRESLWYVMNEDDQHLRIQTQETQFTHRMFIGNLLAYGFGHDGAFEPRLGKVNRIFRPDPGTVIIDIDYLARFAMPITLHQRNPARANPAGGNVEERLGIVGTPLLSVLIEHPQRGWGVITPPQDAFWEQTPVAMASGRRVGLDDLGEAADVTPEFCWFALRRSPFPDLEPVYPEGVAELAKGATMLAEPVA